MYLFKYIILNFKYKQELKMLVPPERYNKSMDLPPYAFVPGYSPHPRSNPSGHSYGKVEEKPQPMDPLNWQNSKLYLYGIDLFNNGFYWEAHEAWESLWHAAGKEGHTADFLKALIKVTAAAVKIRQKQAGGTREHATRAEKIFLSLKNETGQEYFAGLNFASLVEFCRTIAGKAEEWETNPGDQRHILFDTFLQPE
jgi:hypothetical protein